MTIRRANIDDLEAIYEIAEIWDYEEGNDEGTNKQKLFDYAQDDMIDVYEEGEELLGLIISSETSDSLSIYTIYVHPEHRDQGIGSRILEKYTNMLDLKGLKAFGEVEKTNPAIELYKRHGFEIVEHKAIPDDHIFMERLPEPL